jgi:hypothetical protein
MFAGDTFVRTLHEGFAAVACYELSLRGRADGAVPTALAGIAALGTARDAAGACRGSLPCRGGVALRQLLREGLFNLRSLDVTLGDGRGAEDVALLTAALAAAPWHWYLQRLHLAIDYSLTDAEVAGFAAALPGWPKLRSVVISAEESGLPLCFAALAADAERPCAVVINGQRLPPLVLACAHKAGDALPRALAAPGVDVDEEVLRMSALSVAILLGRLEAAGALLRAGACVNGRRKREYVAWPPLLVAAQTGDTAAIALLLAGGADVRLTHGIEGDALSLAAQEGHVAVVTALLAAGMPVDGVLPPMLLTPLLVASRCGQAAVVQVLLRAGGDPNAQCAMGRTALMHGVWHPTVVQLLLDEAACDVKLRDNLGATALHVAAQGGVHGIAQGGAEAARRRRGGGAEEAVRLLLLSGRCDTRAAHMLQAPAWEEVQKLALLLDRDRGDALLQLLGLPRPKQKKPCCVS